MNKEQIESAAMDYSIKVMPAYSDGYFAISQIADAFEEGARWGIKSAWHSTDELPKHSDYLAVLMDNGLMESMYYSAGIGFHEMQLKGYVSWAYIRDLLPSNAKNPSISEKLNQTTD